MAVPRSRILDLVKVCIKCSSPHLSGIDDWWRLVLQTQCRIFATTFNPQRLRLGNKVLRQRLKGPALAAYYPRKTVSFRDLQDTYKPLDLETFDEGQDDREEAIQMYVLCVIISWKPNGSKLIWRITARNYVARDDQRRRELLQVRNRIREDAPNLWFANQLDTFANLFYFYSESRSAKKKK